MIKTLNEQKVVSPLDKISGLAEKVAVYVPSTINVTNTINNDIFVKDIMIKMSKLFGGCTAINCVGSWYSDELEKLVNETITIVYSYTDDLNTEKIDYVITLCEKLKSDMLQECVSVEMNNKLYFI